MIRRLLIWLRLGRFLPRCGARPPWRLADAQPCMIYKGHEQDTIRAGSDEWFHWSGEPDNEYLWNDTRWGWRGPVIDLADEYGAFSADGGYVFTEAPL